MKYRVVAIKSDEGYAVSCPALGGCHSQARAMNEALGNIREAIREWLAADELNSRVCFDATGGRTGEL